ncbi:hypothetical protein [Sediminibacterium sp.]|uniref:hypothetical protein n=1 Tax=Sediminibacterium sp. TaxID=1917865 RepID=UPI0025D181BD|nr:hypothetical protein [Sediminibacterium sp.]MBW0177858.1 hypothetical protein [Sediminibacterium sp.]
MQLLKTIRLVSGFYRNFLLFSIVITVCCASIFWNNGLSSFMTIFWFKIITLGLIYYFVNSNNNKQYYYYFNLGISKFVLWTTTVAFDLALFLFILLLIHKIR